jgi:DNA-binding transcriptional LysR family regulator
VLRIGQQTSVGRGIVEGLVAGVRTRRPAWTVEINQVPWTDPTAGLADETSDVAFCWLPLADPDGYRTQVVVAERVLLAVPAGHALAERAELRFAEIEGLPLVALPEQAGPLRSFWLAEHARDGRAASVAATATTADEALEVVIAGIGGVLISEGNAALYRRPGLAFVPVVDLPASTLALVWRVGDDRDVIRDVLDIVEALPGG